MSPDMKYNRGLRIGPEARISTRKVRFFVLRHGEPEKYGSVSAHLKPNGRHQVGNFTQGLIAELIKDARPKLVRVLRSQRERASETASIVESGILNAMRTDELNRFDISKKLRPKEFLFPDNTMMPLVDQDVALLEDAYSKWLSLTKEEAEEIGCRWSGQVALDMLHLSSRFLDFVTEHEQRGPDLYYVLATHETTLGAVLKHAVPNISWEDLKIGYAEHIELEPRSNMVTSLKFKGKEIGIRSRNVMEKISSQL